MIRGLIPLFIFLGLGALFAVGLTKDPRQLPSELINQPIPDFTLSELYAPDVTLTQEIFKGDVSLLNVFGSWCVACNVEHPLLMEIAAQDTVALIGIDWRDERANGQAWLKARGNPYETVIFDNESLLAIRLGVTGAPETFIIDERGYIRYKHTGIITDKVWAQTLRPLIQNLRAE